MAQKQDIVVWEGEWGQLKDAVRTCRVAATSARTFVSSAIPAYAWASMQAYTSAASDTVYLRSREFAIFCQNTEWLPAASAVTLATTAATVKSIPWGPLVAVRNGVIVGSVCTAAAFPQEVQAFAMQPFSAIGAEQAALDEVQQTLKAEDAAAVPAPKTEE